MKRSSNTEAELKNSAAYKNELTRVLFAYY